MDKLGLIRQELSFLPGMFENSRGTQKDSYMYIHSEEVLGINWILVSMGPTANGSYSILSINCEPCVRLKCVSTVQGTEVAQVMRVS